MPKLFEKLRDTYGSDDHLLHDGHHRYTPLEAATLGKALEPYRLFWLEDCTPAENQEAFKLGRQHTTTPLAVGEIFNTIWDCKDLIQNQLIDDIRATVVGTGGIPHLRRIVDLSALYQVHTGCHGATDFSPVTMGAALHFDIWLPNFGIQEYMRHTPETDAVFPHDCTFSDGFLHCGEMPGHGVTICETMAAKYLQARVPARRAAGRWHEVELVGCPFASSAKGCWSFRAPGIVGGWVMAATRSTPRSIWRGWGTMSRS